MMLRLAVLRAAKAPLEKVLTEYVVFSIHFYDGCHYALPDQSTLPC